MDSADSKRVQDFLSKWLGSEGNERANYQTFFGDLCVALAVDAPPPKGSVEGDRYCFDKNIKFFNEKAETTRFADFYKEGHFLIEAKQGSTNSAKGHGKRGTQGYRDTMQRAFNQAKSYAYNRTFTKALRDRWIPHPKTFRAEIENLWQTMNTGGTFGFEQILRFNGSFFTEATAFELPKEQLEVLYAAAAKDWSQVEPAIFGTLLERALEKKERSRLGAHYTPRSYVERLVRPVVMEPLRQQWDEVEPEVVHVFWALVSGGTLENRPRYKKKRCFDPFPFPDTTSDQKQKIRELGDRLDTHRKQVQAAHPEITITGMYNLLEKLRAGQEFSEVDQAYHSKVRVPTLK